MMRRGLLVVGLILLAGAGYLWAQVDPWKQASAKGLADARAIFEVRDQPDRIGFLLSKDPAILKAVAWSSSGSVVYPGPRTYSPTRYELSLDELDDLTRATSGDFAANWSDYDRDGTELLYCQPEPRICLVYDQTELQQAAPASATWVHHGAIGLLTLMGALSLISAWLSGRGAAEGKGDQLVLLPEDHAARRGALKVDLTPRDFRLLQFLQARQGKVATKDELYDAGWGRDFMPNSRALDQHMINLRKKLDPDKSRAPVIETVRGVGYRLLE